MQKRLMTWAVAAVFYFFAAAFLVGCASSSGSLPVRSLGERHATLEGRKSIELAEVIPLSAEDEVQVRCLAENVYHEARGEPERGQEAVALVVLNRVESGTFPDNICGVVWDRNNRGCQFSWTCDGRSDRIRDEVTYNAIYERMREFYIDTPVDFTRGAEYYHANYVRPSWSRVFQRTVQIGTHIFYRG